MKNNRIEQIYTLAILSGMPSLANYILSSIESIDERITTAATDGYIIFYSKDFIESLTIKEGLFVFSHEFYHIIYNHLERGKDMTAAVQCTNKNGESTIISLWNLATDIIVNDAIKSRLKQKMLSCAIQRGEGFFKDLPNECNTSNKIYNWALNNLDNAISPEEVTESKEMEEGQKGAKKESKKVLSESMVDNNRKSIAIEEEKKAGNQSEELQEFIPTEIDTDWIDLFQAIAIETGRHIHLKKKRSYQRPARYEPKGFCMRGSKTSRPKPSVSLYVDVSGSMNDNPTIIMQGLKPILSRLIFFRSKFYIFNTDIKEIDRKVLKFDIGGGTDIKKVIEHMSADINIIITDCEDNIKRCDFPSNAIIVSNNAEFADYITEDWTKVKKQKKGNK